MKGLRLNRGYKWFLKVFYEELFYNKTKPIRTQEPNPLRDRKALDDIIFHK